MLREGWLKVQVRSHTESTLAADRESERNLPRALRAAQHDARFPAALAQLQERGLSVNTSDPEYLASAMVPLEEDYELIQAQPPTWAGGNANRAIWSNYGAKRHAARPLCPANRMHAATNVPPVCAVSARLLCSQ